MDPNRKLWNDRQKKLSLALTKGDREQALALFLDQHAMIHGANASPSKLHSFQDELLNDMTELELRQVPPSGEHSIAWILFHLARIEDITSNLLVAGTQQIFDRSGWVDRLNVSILHSANGMDRSDVVQLSWEIEIRFLLSYRIAVARRTRQIVKTLKRESFKQKVSPVRIRRVLEQGAVTSEALEIVNYWSKRTIAGLLLMPPTRHNFLHLNEAMRIKQKMRRTAKLHRSVFEPT